MINTNDNLNMVIAEMDAIKDTMHGKYVIYLKSR